MLVCCGHFDAQMSVTLICKARQLIVEAEKAIYYCV